MDEPTNHLDLLSKEVLLEALKSYTGTLVFVSHDRYFVDNLAERVIHIDQQVATSHLGNYEYFLGQMDNQGDNTHSSLRVESNQSTQEDSKIKVAGKEQYQQSKEEKTLLK